LVCSATAGANIPLGISQLWFNYITASFFKALDMHFPREAKERAGPCLTTYFLCMDVISSAYQAFVAITLTPGHL